ncbi:hypothetical protein ACJA27_01535 [Mycoplasmopsis lipophila]|uniref:hypothetical protein n=1 Tax=Mycoplasmopsis lipophila TaxID=2117 RepID=UPI003872CCF0
MEEINKLNFSIDEFKNNYWYSKNIDIPQFVKNIEPNITEEQFFNKLLLNVFNTCDLFINQKMSQFLILDITLEQIKDILGEQRVKNFISSVYTEIKYRIASEKFPEFSQRDKLITSNFSLAQAGREFNNFQGLLSPEAIAYLTSPSWIDLKFKKDDYLNIVSIIEKLNLFDNRIEKLLKDNSELDENLKTSFLTFKSNQETKNINLQDEINKKQNLIENKILGFLNKNVLNDNELGNNDGEYLNINFGDSGSDIGITLKSEYFNTTIEPSGIQIENVSEGMSYLDSSNLEFKDSENKTISKLTAQNLNLLLNNLDKTKSLEDKFNLFDNRIEKLLKYNSESDENLKLSFSKFKSEQLEINDKKENKLSDNVRNFLNNNINSPDYLGLEDGDDYVKITFDNDELGMDVCQEQYRTYIRPEGIEILGAGKGIDLSYDKISFPHPDDESKPKQTINYENVEKWNTSIKKAINNENKISDIYNKLKNDTSINLYESLKTLFQCQEWDIDDKQNKTIDNFYQWYLEDDTILNVIFQDKEKNIAMSLKNEDNEDMFLDFSNTEQCWIRNHPFIDDAELRAQLGKKQDQDLWIKLKSDDNYSLINFSKEQSKIRFGSNLSQGFISNFFFDRERDGRNIVRYIEKENETFLNLTPALQGDTHVEIGIKNSNKYISLKIDNEELFLDKTKLLKLKSLLS